ncbi:retinol dehydrogenase 12 [Tribolium castaneum]|uniref:WW domain-containing oxidoreductase-like Protein n=1 Tax=Tribolium castaneum TaxID=7070 RepID=D6X003_TRICA|nr:PREDICTED: retinol dehydrogenase 12 [Tribolium castaneum]EFA09615.1 WW domain-containing oxidoreductase-like Protein [Tribolium castaneum]|eukprot:XP_975163.1 PREDICTED: retinol dehydrogenase 12 [Tribolium castaneum]
MLFLCLTVLVILWAIARLTLGITRSPTCLVGKTALVTGANSGLGYQTVLNLASRGCTVIMADVADMEESKKQIIKATNNPNIITKKIDLTSFKSVRNFATEILNSVDKLDILFNNAGIGVSPSDKTGDGYNPVMQINYFGHFLLTHLLIDLLKRSAPSRIVSTSSLLAYTNNLSVKKLYETKSPDSTVPRTCLYGNSKLCLIIMTDILAEKLKNTGVTANSVHPGLVTTPIFTNTYTVIKNNFLSFLSQTIHAFFAKDPWEGSQTMIHVGVDKNLENVTGKFFSDCKPFVKPRCAYDKEWCRKIWEETEKIVDLAPSEKI